MKSYILENLPKVESFVQPYIIDKLKEVASLTGNNIALNDDSTVSCDLVLKNPDYSSWFFTSDQTECHMRYNQPCWGPIAGLKPKQTNGWMFLASLKNTPIHERMWDQTSILRYMFEALDKEVFLPNATFEDKQTFIKTFGVILPPRILESFSSVEIVGFILNLKRVGSCYNSCPEDTTIGQWLIFKLHGVNGSGWSSLFVTGNEASRKNVLAGKMNPSLEKLPNFLEDPDYSSYWHGIFKLYDDVEITRTGHTYRPGDIKWEEHTNRLSTMGEDAMIENSIKHEKMFPAPTAESVKKLGQPQKELELHAA